MEKYDTIFNDSNEILEKINLQEKPDIIIGNPPYVPLSKMIDIKNKSDNNSFLEKLCGNLYIGALYRAIELVKDNGIISYIIPKNFLHVNAYSEIRRKILNENTIVSVIDIGAYFKQVRGEQIILTIKKQAPESEHKIHFKKYKKGRLIHSFQLNQEFYQDKIVIFKNQQDFKIYNKFMNSYEVLGDFCRGFVGRGTSKAISAVKGKEIRKFCFKGRDIPTTGDKIFIQNIYSAESGIIGCFAGGLDAGETVTVLTDSNSDMCRFLLGILHSRLCNYYLFKYCYNSSKLTMHTDAKYLLQIPVIKDTDYFDGIVTLVKNIENLDYLSMEWYRMYEELNLMIYDLYKINTKEKNYIEKEVKEIQSKRWVSCDGKKAANE